MSAFSTQTRTELALSLRQGEQMLVSIGIPLLVLVFFSTVDVLPLPAWADQPVDFLVPGVIALAIMSASMVSLGIGTGFERQHGVLKRLGVTPLGRPTLVSSKITMVLALEVIQITILLLASLALGWRPDGPIALIVPATMAGTAAFAGIGLTMAGTLRGTTNLAATNGLYLVFLLLGGMIIPLSELPQPVETIAELLPAAALTETITAAMTAGVTASTQAWVVLVIWAVAAPLAAAKWFRWH